MAKAKRSKKVILELELPASKLKALAPLIKNGKLNIVLGPNSFIACNAPFVACNAPFSEGKAAFIACNAAFK